MKNTAKTKHNWWKWAFFVLLALILITIGTIWHAVYVPSTTAQTVETTKPVKSQASFYVELNRKQVNAIVNSYLTQLQKGQSVKYRFVIGKKYGTVTGRAKLLNVPVQFAVNFIPEKLSDGNVMLHARGMEIGRLNLPMKFVLGYIANHYKMPKWVTINANKKTVLLDLNKYSKHKTMHYSADNINMSTGTFRFLISIPQTK